MVEDYSARSVFVINIDDLICRSILGFTIEKFKLLKLLDFSIAPLDYIPREVGKLCFLKSLNLRNTKVKMLPKSIGKLHNLHLVNTHIHNLPIEINKLRNLRHLLVFHHDHATGYGYGAFRGLRTHEGIGHFVELQTLTNVEAYHHHGFSLVKELETMSQLRWLCI
ncbi:LRR domain containing protein [Parasponia andersonii]|uniref:LRR domain containing protein n=1 Tax=Parasponia andersonii TaxID=3476 RepID=A0A2P5B939_PARAD|nr:LRR domain containing protein [Parasponia andersonii]